MSEDTWKLAAVATALALAGVVAVGRWRRARGRAPPEGRAPVEAGIEEDFAQWFAENHGTDRAAVRAWLSATWAGPVRPPPCPLVRLEAHASRLDANDVKVELVFAVPKPGGVRRVTLSRIVPWHQVAAPLREAMIRSGEATVAALLWPQAAAEA